MSLISYSLWLKLVKRIAEIAAKEAYFAYLPLEVNVSMSQSLNISGVHSGQASVVASSWSSTASYSSSVTTSTASTVANMTSTG